MPGFILCANVFILALFSKESWCLTSQQINETHVPGSNLCHPIGIALQQELDYIQKDVHVVLD